MMANQNRTNNRVEELYKLGFTSTKDGVFFEFIKADRLKFTINSFSILYSSENHWKDKINEFNQTINT